MKTRRGVRKGCCLSSILFNLYSKCLTKEAFEGSGDFKIRGQIIHTVKYADDLVLLVSGVPRNFVRVGVEGGGASTNSVEDRGQREGGSAGGSPLVRGSGGSCNLV